MCKAQYLLAMKKYMEELQALKPWDSVQFNRAYKNTGLQFIHTAGHGYLVVPALHPQSAIAMRICKYGFIGQHAIYLEEDSEMHEFLQTAFIPA